MKPNRLTIHIAANDEVDDYDGDTRVGGGWRRLVFNCKALSTTGECLPLALGGAVELRLQSNMMSALSKDASLHPSPLLFPPQQHQTTMERRCLQYRPLRTVAAVAFYAALSKALPT